MDERVQDRRRHGHDTLEEDGADDDLSLIHIFIAVCTTGAYNYSMASNYNRIPRPPVVMLSGGKPTLAVRRETVDDLTALDM